MPPLRSGSMSSTSTLDGTDKIPPSGREKDVEHGEASNTQQAQIPPQSSPQKPFAEKSTTRIKVEWPANDPANPYNWATSYKCFVTVQLGLLGLAPSFGSSVMAPANEVIAN